jgi:hypothetical protein
MARPAHTVDSFRRVISEWESHSKQQPKALLCDKRRSQRTKLLDIDKLIQHKSLQASAVTRRCPPWCSPALLERRHSGLAPRDEAGAGGHLLHHLPTRQHDKSSQQKAGKAHVAVRRQEHDNEEGQAEPLEAHQPYGRKVLGCSTR